MTDSTHDLLEILAKILFRCWIFGFLLLLLWFGIYMLASDVIYRLHGSMFDLTKHDLDVIHYCGMAFVKLSVMITTNQAYGAGTMIGQWPARIMASCPEPKETYITATISLEQVRQARKNSRNLQQRRLELYGEIVTPVPIVEAPSGCPTREGLL